MLRLHVALLLTAVLCACRVSAQNLIFFNPILENIFEGRFNNCITLVRFGSGNEVLTINYTVSGIDISPDDFTGGSFSIIYPNNTDPLKVPINLTDNSVCDGPRTIVVTITGIDKCVPVPDSDVRHYIVVDDDGEWTAWDTSEGPCNCETAMRDRFRNRTCNDKGIPGRTCDGPATINDTVSCAGDPACTTTTTPMPTSTTTTGLATSLNCEEMCNEFDLRNSLTVSDHNYIHVDVYFNYSHNHAHIHTNDNTLVSLVTTTTLVSLVTTTTLVSLVTTTTMVILDTPMETMATTVPMETLATPMETLATTIPMETLATTTTMETLATTTTMATAATRFVENTIYTVK
ncbi:mucin-22-like [Haliotis asinina]|uniref:mucin-22-like n=1 Tax=Haliotis asinina TaxID=109174 RepID=UPI003531D6A6